MTRRGQLPSCARKHCQPACSKFWIAVWQKEPRDRYQKIDELRDDLRGVFTKRFSASQATGQPFASVTPETGAPLARRKSCLARDALAEGPES